VALGKGDWAGLLPVELFTAMMCKVCDSEPDCRTVHDGRAVCDGWFATMQLDSPTDAVETGWKTERRVL
jgi:hypothetical protein